MFRRDRFDTFMDHFFDERDQYFNTVSERMNSMYDEMHNTLQRLDDTDVEMKDEENNAQPFKGTVKTLNHYESQNQRVYTDENGKRHFYERRVENVPDKENHFRIVTTKRILPKGKTLEDLKQLKDTEKKDNAQQANEDDFVENVTEEVVHGLPEHHMEMLDNWYGRSRIGDKSKKSILESKNQATPSEENQHQEKQLQQQEQQKQQIQKENTTTNTSVNDEERKQHIESLKNEFDQQFKHIENQFENMRNKLFKKLNSDSFF